MNFFLRNEHTPNDLVVHFRRLSINFFLTIYVKLGFELDNFIHYSNIVKVPAGFGRPLLFL